MILLPHISTRNAFYGFVFLVTKHLTVAVQTHFNPVIAITIAAGLTFGICCFGEV